MASSRCITLVIFSILAVVDCVNLTDPDKGQVTYTAGTTFRQTVTYSCNTGYNLVGTVLVLSCRKVVWECTNLSKYVIKGRSHFLFNTYVHIQN